MACQATHIVITQSPVNYKIMHEDTAMQNSLFYAFHKYRAAIPDICSTSPCNLKVEQTFSL